MQNLYQADTLETFLSVLLIEDVHLVENVCLTLQHPGVINI